MAVDKLVDSSALNTNLTSVANAIRTKGGTSAQLAFPSQFISAINAIQTGGPTSRHIRVLYPSLASPVRYVWCVSPRRGTSSKPNTLAAMFFQLHSGDTGIDYWCAIVPKSNETSIVFNDSGGTFYTLIFFAPPTSGEPNIPAQAWLTYTSTGGGYGDTDYEISLASGGSGWTFNGIFIALGEGAAGGWLP